MAKLSGGSDMIVWDKSVVCPACGSTCVHKTDDGISKYLCAICGARFDW